MPSSRPSRFSNGRSSRACRWWSAGARTGAASCRRRATRRGRSASARRCRPPRPGDAVRRPCSCGPSMARYSAWSRRIWTLVSARVPLAQQVGIDEGYLDLTGAVSTAGEAERFLRELQELIRDGDGPRRVVWLRHVEGGREDRLRPPQAARRDGGAGRPRGRVPGAAAAARAAGHRPEVGRAAAGRRAGADRRPGGAGRRPAGAPAARRRRRRAARPRPRHRPAAGVRCPAGRCRCRSRRRSSATS